MGTSAQGLQACIGACDAMDDCFAIQWSPFGDWCNTCVSGGITLEEWAQTSGQAEVRSKECWAGMPCSPNCFSSDDGTYYTCEVLDEWFGQRDGVCDIDGASAGFDLEAYCDCSGCSCYSKNPAPTPAPIAVLDGGHHHRESDGGSGAAVAVGLVLVPPTRGARPWCTLGGCASRCAT